MRQTTGDGGSNRAGFDETATFFSAGAPLNLGGDWRLVGGVGGFEITSSIDKVVAELAAGMDWIASDGMVLRLQYEGRFGEETEQHGGNIKLTVPF